MTHVTTTANTYESSLQEAANYIKLHKNDGIKEIPEDIIQKAIGKRPAFCDSPDIDAMQEARLAHYVYKKEVELFIKKAVELAESH